MKMTPGMKQVLEEARRNGELRRARTREPGADPWPASWQTLHALVRRGYLERGERRNRKGERLETWTITEAGKAALNPPRVTRQGKPQYLAPVTGHTSIASRAEDWEWGTVMGRNGRTRVVKLPVEDMVGPERLHSRWSVDARARHDEVRGKLNCPPGRKAA